MNTLDLIKKMRLLDSRATTGPWFVEEYEETIPMDDGTPVMLCNILTDEDGASLADAVLSYDAEFIKESRDAVPIMCDRLEMANRLLFLAKTYLTDADMYHEIQKFLDLE